MRERIGSAAAGRRPTRGAVVLALLVLAAVVAAGLPAGAGRRVEEKDINLDIARRVRVRLLAAGIPVVMTRATDRTLPLAARVAVANARRVDAFVSIHNNSSRSPRASGSQVYHQVRGGDSRRLGSLIRDALASRPGLRSTLHARRGQRGDYYYVLRRATMPAVIVEGAFVSNPTEARLLASPRFRQALADSIARGILAYQRTLRAAPLGSAVKPLRFQVPALPTPEAARGAAVNARMVRLSWAANPSVPAYRVYRDGVFLGSVPSPLPDDPAAGRVGFADRWAAPGQGYTYEIVAAAGPDPAAVESVPARVRVRTPPIVVALDPGHGGRDPGAVGTY